MPVTQHPYRSVEPEPEPEPEQGGVKSEETILYVVLAMLGAIPVSVAACGGMRFGTEATIGLMMLVVGGVGVVGTLWSRSSR